MKSQNEANDYFVNLFQKAKPGAIFLFIDNNSPKFYDWFDDLAQNNLVKILVNKKDNICIPFDEDKNDLGDYFSKFSFPKLKANVAYRVGIKL